MIGLRMDWLHRAACFALGVFFTAGISGAALPVKLTDVNGRAHAAVGRTVVLAWTGLGCPMSKLYRPRLERLANFAFPVVRDDDGKLAREFKVARTTEVLLLDAKGAVVYRGAVDDQFGFRKNEEGGGGGAAIPAVTILYIFSYGNFKKML